MSKTTAPLMAFGATGKIAGEATRSPRNSQHRRTRTPPHNFKAVPVAARIPALSRGGYGLERGPPPSQHHQQSFKAVPLAARIPALRRGAYGLERGRPAS